MRRGRRNPILLVDGNNLLWRGHHANPKLSSKKRLTGALHTSLKMLLNMPTLFKPQPVIFLWDYPPSWRKKIDPNYKFHRSYKTEADNAMRAGVIAQIELFKELLTCLGIASVTEPGLEADDLAGILTTALRKKSRKVTLVSADKDWFQLLVQGWVEQVRGWSGKKLDVWDGQRLIKEHGVHPESWAYYLALVGDSGDNIPKALRGRGGPVLAKKIIQGCDYVFDDTEAQRLETNLKLTNVLRSYPSFNERFELPERTTNNWIRMQAILEEYDLVNVLAEDEKLWEVGAWARTPSQI